MPPRERFTAQTGPVYKYTTPIWESGAACSLLNLQIDVTASSDCHIWVCDRERESRGYEVVIGGWKNTRSEIRRGKQGQALSTIFHDGSAKPLKYNGGKFWVSVMPNDHDVTIVIGKGWDLWKDKIMTAVDKSKKKISTLNQVSVTTGFGSEGDWTVYVDTQETEPRISIDESCTNTVIDEPKNTPPRQIRTSSFNTPIRDTLVSTIPIPNNFVTGKNLLKRPRNQSPRNNENRSPATNLGNIDQAISKHAAIPARTLAQPPPKRRR